jgi:hypothetical protein
MAHLTRIASAGQTNPIPQPGMEHLTPEEIAEYTFILTNGDEQSYITESAAVREIPLVAHLAVGQTYLILGS